MVPKCGRSFFLVVKNKVSSSCTRLVSLCTVLRELYPGVSNPIFDSECKLRTQRQVYILRIWNGFWIGGGRKREIRRL